MQEGRQSRAVTDNYTALYEAWRREKHRSDVQPLPEGFHAAMAGYIQALREQQKAADKAGLQGRIMAEEQQHAERMIREIHAERLRKIVTLELDEKPADPLNLTIDEKRFQVEIRRTLSTHAQSVKPLAAGKPPQQEATPEPPRPQPQQPPRHAPSGDLKVVRLLQPLPAIMGVDMKTYGPFKAEDIASIPAQNADNLIKKGAAKLVEDH
jgi:DNA replication factor GINS